MDNILQIVRQELIEKNYSRKHIDGYIKEAIKANPDMVNRMGMGVELVKQYMSGTYYASKNARIAQLVGLDIEQLVLDVFTGVAYCQTPELMTSVAAQVAARLKLDDKTDAIKTTSELLAVLCNTDAYDISKAGKYSSLMVQSRIPLGEELLKFVEQSNYLPPMVCEPLELEHNYSSGYLSHNDCLILGQGNMHDGDICLDVLNKINKVCLRLDTEFLSKVEEEPTFELDDREKQQAWDKFKRDSYKFYLLVAEQGNEFYLTNKVDKRGRIYAQGYHITSQGTSFKKAMIELANEEIVTGVPTN